MGNTDDLAPPPKLTLEQYEKIQPTATLTLDGKQLTFSTPNWQTMWRAETLLTKEPITIEWLKRIQADDVLFDIGANVGVYTVVAAVLRGARVFAFEPEGQNFALLCRNIALNNINDLVVPFPLAVSSCGRLDVLNLSEFSTGGGSCHSFGAEVGFDLQPRAAAFKQGAYSISIDDMVATGSLPLPNYLKIDVDGIEHKVIAGARRTLTNPEVKSVIIELNTNLDEHNAVFAAVTDLGFSFDEDQVARAKRTEGPFQGTAEVVFDRI